MCATLPSSHRAGDSLSASYSLGDYPASAGWVLSFVLINASNKITLTCVASADAHALGVTAATSAAWVAGVYTYTAQVTKAPDRITLATGSLEILRDLAAETTFDTRSPARKALEAAEAALAVYGSKAYLQKIAIGDREQTFTSAGDFLAFISKLRTMVAAEDNATRLAQGLGSRNKLLVRFTRR